MFVITFWLFCCSRSGVHGLAEWKLTLDSPRSPDKENRMSRNACRKTCDGQNARLPLPYDLKLGGLNGLVSVLYRWNQLLHSIVFYAFLWANCEPFKVRKLSENDRNYFLRSSRQNETMFVSDIGSAFHDFNRFSSFLNLTFSISHEKPTETTISQVQVLHIWVGSEVKLRKNYKIAIGKCVRRFLFNQSSMISLFSKPCVQSQGSTQLFFHSMDQFFIESI